MAKDKVAKMGKLEKKVSRFGTMISKVLASSQLKMDRKVEKLQTKLDKTLEKLASLKSGGKPQKEKKAKTAKNKREGKQSKGT